MVFTQITKCEAETLAVGKCEAQRHLEPAYESEGNHFFFLLGVHLLNSDGKNSDK